MFWLGRSTGLQDEVIASSCQLVYLTTGIPSYFTSEHLSILFVLHLVGGKCQVNILVLSSCVFHQIRRIPGRVEADRPCCAQCEPKHV